MAWYYIVVIFGLVFFVFVQQLEISRLYKLARMQIELIRRLRSDYDTVIEHLERTDKRW